MSNQDLIKEITEKLYGHYGDKLREEFWKEWKEFCTNYPANRLMEIFNHLRHNPSNDRRMDISWAPTIEQFVRAAKQLNIRPKKVNSFSAFQCRTCKTLYAIESRGCPKCKKITDTKTVVSHFPFDFIQLQEDCYKCPWGLDYRNEVGPTCADYGTGRVIELCATCKCRECCEEVAGIAKDNENRWEKGKYDPDLIHPKEEE